MSELHTLSLAGLSRMLQVGEVRAEEAVRASLDRIRDTDPKIKALLCVQEEQALEQARDLDREGPDPTRPLWGVPAVIKDVVTTAGVPTTCGSRMLQDFVPFYDATVVDRLKQAGALVLAKSNMDEFAMGSSTENSAFFPTRNPWDLERVPGGSSGGSAASTAACQTTFSIGTDTGGSIRQPASFCGVVGLKPTYGRVSRFGLVAYGSSLDQIGPLTRTVEDSAAVLQVVAGHDPRDSTSVDRAVPDYLGALDRRPDLNGLTLGVPEEYLGEGLDSEVEASCRAAIEQARSLGAKIVSVSLPHTPYAIAAYYIVVMAEASSNLARYDGVRYGLRDKSATELKEMYRLTRSAGFGEEVQRRIILGTYVLSAGYYDAYYRKAAQVRRLIRDDFASAFASCDVIVGPASPTTAFRLGEKTDDPLQMYLTDIFTTPLNLSGLPGLCLPAGLGKDSGMPVGLQLIGPAFGEERLLQVGHLLEKSLPSLPRPAAL